MKRKPRVFFTGYLPTSFVKTDLEILRRHFDVRTLDLSVKKPRALKAFKLLRGTLWADVTFSWFANSYAALAVRLSKKLGKKSIVVIGGYEVDKISELDYGAVLKPESERIVRSILENATRVLMVDAYLKTKAIENFGVSGKNIETIHLGLDPAFWKPHGKKQRMALTVGGVDRLTLKLKGIENFVQAAKYVPDAKFAVIGKDIDGSAARLKKTAPPNVVFVGFLPQDKLVKEYQKAKAYCQLSLSEGFASTLCEAMFCGCVPVGTRRGGIPAKIGNTGFFVPCGNPKATAAAVKQALKSSKGAAARRRAVQNFTLEKREKKLVRTIQQLAAKQA